MILRVGRVQNVIISGPGGDFFDVRKRHRFLHRFVIPKVTKRSSFCLHFRLKMRLKKKEGNKHGKKQEKEVGVATFRRRSGADLRNARGRSAYAWQAFCRHKTCMAVSTRPARHKVGRRIQALRAFRRAG